MKETLTDLSEFQRLPRNPKDHDVGELHAAMIEFGFIDPVVVNKTTGRLLAGHGRVDALQQMKASGEIAPIGIKSKNGSWFVPTFEVELAEGKEEAAAIALNRIPERGGWNDAMLAQVLADLAAKDQLAGTGFDSDDVDNLLKDIGKVKHQLETSDAEAEPPDMIAIHNKCPQCGFVWQGNSEDLAQ